MPKNTRRQTILFIATITSFGLFGNTTEAQLTDTENTVVEALVTEDHDQDGIPSTWEVLYGMDPVDPADAAYDMDNDGLINLLEYVHLTDPTNPDTDGGGLGDGDEISQGKDPLDPTDDIDPEPEDDEDDIDFNDARHNPKAGKDPRIDSDGDGLTDIREKRYGTNINNRDTDGDNLDDYSELFKYFTNPLVSDTDGDGISDGDEVFKHKTNPNKWDSDFDRLSDYSEIYTHKTNPLLQDTDSGGIPDGDEVLSNATNPLDPTDDISVKIDFFIGDINYNQFTTLDSSRIQVVKDTKLTVKIQKPNHIDAVKLTYNGVTEIDTNKEVTFNIDTKYEGTKEVIIELIIGGTSTRITKYVEIQNKGIVFARNGGTFKNLLGSLNLTNEGPLNQATVKAFKYDEKYDRWENYIDRSHTFSNPQVTTQDGSYAFVLSPGIYRIVADGKYSTEKSIFIDANTYLLVNKNIYVNYNLDSYVWIALFVAIFHLIYGMYLLFLHISNYKTHILRRKHISY